MSLAGPNAGHTFWGSWWVIFFFGLMMAFSVIVGPVKFLEGYLASWTQYAVQAGATVFMAVDRAIVASRQKKKDKSVAKAARQVLDTANTLIDEIGDPELRSRESFYTKVLDDYAAKLFPGREVRAGFYLLESADAEEGKSHFLKLAAEATTNVERMTPILIPNQAKDGTEDIPQQMIDRILDRQNLCVPNVRKKYSDWKPDKTITKYNCFVSIPVVPRGTRPDHDSPKAFRGLLNIDSKILGDITDDDKKWARLVADMLYNGATRWVGTPRVASEPRILAMSDAPYIMSDTNSGRYQ